MAAGYPVIFGQDNKKKQITKKTTVFEFFLQGEIAVYTQGLYTFSLIQYCNYVMKCCFKQIFNRREIKKFVSHANVGFDQKRG